MELFNGKYQQELLIGRGAFSEVWKVTDVQTGVKQVLKIYTPSAAMGDNGMEMMKHEFALMANTNHQNLLRPLYFDVCDNRPYLVLSYCKNGNISSKVGRFSERDAWKLLRDAASALAYLHEQTPPIVHQDIKPANILIADNGSYMLTDFGVSTKAKTTMAQESDEEKMLQSAGTFPYMPPEKFTDNNLPIMASDIWSLGATTFEMLTGQLPFGNDGGLLQRMGNEVPDLPGDYSQDLKDTIKNCMASEPWLRPKAEDLENTAVQMLSTMPTLQPFQKTTTPAPEPENRPQAIRFNEPEPVTGPQVIEPVPPVAPPTPSWQEEVPAPHVAPLAWSEPVRQEQQPYPPVGADEEEEQTSDSSLTFWLIVGLAAILSLVVGIIVSITI